MYKGVILVKNKGQLIPDEMIKLALEQNTSFFGIATNSDGKISSLEEPKPLDITDFKDFQEGSKDERILFFLGQSDATVADNMLQPFTVLKDGKGTDQIVAFVDAELPGFDKEKMAIPPEFTFINTYLAPKIGELSGYAGGDLAKLADMMRGPVFQKDILAQAERMTLALMFSSGELLTLDKNPLRSAYPWGWSSKNFGYVNAAEEKPEPPAGKPSLLDRMRGGKKPDAVIVNKTEPKLEEAVASKPTATAEPPKTETTEMVSPPEGLKERDLKFWYTNNFGYRPKSWHTRPAMPKSKMKVKTLSDLKPAQEQKQATSTPNTKPNGTDTSNKHIPEKDVSKPVVRAPLLSAEERKDIITNFVRDPEIVKAIDKDGEVMMDPSKYKEYEDKLPSIRDQLGLTPEELNKWPLFILQEFAVDYPQAAGSMLHNLRGQVNYLQQKMAGMIDKPASDVKKETETVEESVQQAVPRRRFNRA